MNHCLGAILKTSLSVRDFHCTDVNKKGGKWTISKGKALVESDQLL